MTDPTETLRRWFGETQSPERSACASWLSDVDPKGYQLAYQVFAREHGPDPVALTRLTCPAVFMTGEKEPNSTPTMSKRLARLVPQGTSEIVEGAAHMMPMTHARQVNDRLLHVAREVL